MRLASRFRLALPAVLALPLLVGVITQPATATTASAPCVGTAAGTAPSTWDHVVLIMFENKPLKRIIGNTTDAPYINSIAKACSYATKDSSLSTTSLANYVALTSGYTGCDQADSNGVCTHELPITANQDPKYWPQATKSLFEMMNDGTGQDLAIEWAESMDDAVPTQPAYCRMVSDSGSGLFTVSHTPYQYYTRTQKTSCPADARPFPANPADVQSGTFNLVIPNKKDIMHKIPNTTISQRIQNGDNWLKGYLPQLLNSSTYQAGRTVILITWDEGNNTNFIVPLIVISPYTTAGGTTSTTYDHYSVLKGIQQMVGFATPLLGHAGDPGKNSIRDDSVFRLK